ncbi:MAG TPA: DUF6069 family protein [Pseudonocardiaceae bacterium]|nr:DUF6069 family protein [Pseudonocardiaceae bacterium]
MNVNPAEPDLRPDPRRLWAAGGATAVVAALAALVGILISRGLAHVAILAPQGDGAWGDASTTVYVILSAVVALLATALLHFLLVTTPRATTFFGWIMGLLIVVSMVIPLSLGANIDERVATALLNLLIGLAITLPLTNVGSFVRPGVVMTRRTNEMPPPPPQTRQYERYDRYDA